MKRIGAGFLTALALGVAVLVLASGNDAGALAREGGAGPPPLLPLSALAAAEGPKSALQRFLRMHPEAELPRDDSCLISTRRCPAKACMQFVAEKRVRCDRYPSSKPHFVPLQDPASAHHEGKP